LFVIEYLFEQNFEKQKEKDKMNYMRFHLDNKIFNKIKKNKTKQTMTSVQNITIYLKLPKIASK